MKRKLITTLFLALPAMAAASPQAAVDALLKARARPDAPGCALALARSGEALVLKAYGMANLEHGIAIDPARTVFNIASLSKQFTAAGILLLEQDGKFSLSDDVHRFLPGLPDFGHKITVAHLLHHTSGLRDYAGMAMVGERHQSDYTDNDTIMEFIQRQQGLDFVPGSEHLYSNTGYFLLARIIERASGKDYAAFVKERLFQPLGMRHTSVPTGQGSLLPGRASGYLPGEGEGEWRTAIGGWVETGARGVYTTAADLAKWQANFSTLQLGGKALRTALLKQGRLDDGTRIDYAGGLHVGQFMHMPTVEHGGADQGFRAEMLHLPTAGLSVTVLCNDMRADPGGLARAVLGNYLPPVAAKEAPGAAPSAAPTPVAPEFAGSYWARQRGLVRQVRLEEGKLWYVRSPRSRSPLLPLGGGRFQVGDMDDGTELIFSRSGGSTRMHLVSPLDKAIEFDAVTPPGVAKPDEFAGTFVSREYDARWIVTSGKDGVLMRSVREQEGEARKFEPLAADAFHGPGMVVRFVRDGTGNVRALEVDTSRSRKLVFEKI